MGAFPYSDRYEVHRSLPARGTDRASVLTMLADMSMAENPVWEGGQCSGTMYCGDHDHYDFLNEAFAHFSYVNSLQRDMCPSSTKFEAEIIAMTLDLLGASAVTDTVPAGLVTSGGTASILHAVLSYREANPNANRPNMIKPETAHPAFAKAGHLFGVEMKIAPVDPRTTLVDVDWVRNHIDANTIALIGSACNYGYGTVDPISELGALALEREIGLHVDGCLGAFLLPFGRELGYDIEPFDFSVPGVTTISADTHKYGYALKGTSVLCYADRALRNAQYFYLTDWSGGKYCSPGMDGSRSGGLLAATWAAMVHLGREGYRRYAEDILRTATDMREAVAAHPSLRIMGSPSFLFSMTSDVYDIYHVNDFLRGRGWRLNGQQYPNALHMAVTRPQTQPGVLERWARDLADAVDYALEHRHEAPHSGAIYGGVEGGSNDEIDAIVKIFMADMMDTQMAVPVDE
ncbi:MAG TPA: aminotransferase class V-fold PLP-dependent enzyme [Acidimicrobiales bacterium]|nr:aminotransferase class V-fold PLP-dependent enzyme [Acidimicrobiales bacterium]